MKVINLRNRIIFCDDIIQIYVTYNPTRYYVETKNDSYTISLDDYVKIKKYLISLNDKELPKEDKKIEFSHNIKRHIDFNENERLLLENQLWLENKINEIIDKVNGE